jgi:hypothetical protein
MTKNERPPSGQDGGRSRFSSGEAENQKISPNRAGTQAVSCPAYLPSPHDPEPNGHAAAYDPRAALAAAVDSFGVTGDKAERLRILLQNHPTADGRFIDKGEMKRRADAGLEFERATHPGKDKKSCDESSYAQANGAEASIFRTQLEEILGLDLPIEREATARLPAESGRQEIVLPPPPDRKSLLLSAWIKRPTPLRDFLMGGVMCTTSRWFIWGDTGNRENDPWHEHGGSHSGGGEFSKVGRATARARDVSRRRAARRDVQRAHAVDRGAIRRGPSILWLQS